MKVTVVRDNHTSQLVKPAKSGKSVAKMCIRKVIVEKSTHYRLTPCLVGIVIGFLLSQWISWRNTNSSDMQIKLDLPDAPIDAYVIDNILHVKHKSSQSTTDQVQDSLYMLAMLKLAQENLQQKITQEGFIVIEPDPLAEETESVKLVLSDNDFVQNDEIDLDSESDLFDELFFPGRQNNDKIVNFNSYLDEESPSKDS